MRVLGRSLALSFVFFLLVYACTSDPADPGDDTGNGGGETRSMAIHAGNQQQATVGTAVATAPAVRITNQNGQGVAGIQVTFAVASGGGSVSGGTQTTNADGVATVGSWTLGTTAGTNTLTATAQGNVNGSPVTFTATGVPAQASSLTRAGGDNQSAVAGTAVATPPSVRVTDAFGNGISGIQVTFTVETGGGSVTGATQTTNANGVATVGSWTLGPVPGPNTLMATADIAGLTGNPALFTATGTVGPPAQLTIIAGDHQHAAPGAVLPIQPAVRLTDAADRPVSGVTVTFAVASGGGSVTGAVQETNEDGIATVGSWTLGPEPGDNTLTATAEGSGINGNPATFTAHAEHPEPAALEIVAGQDEVQIAGRAVQTPPAVRVTDADGNPVPGVHVMFMVTGGGGTIEAGAGSDAMDSGLDAAGSEEAMVETDHDGVASLASWTLGPDVGENTVLAVVEGLDPIVFTATGAFNPEDFAGTWTGQWQNLTFPSSGPVMLSISVDAETQTMNFNLDLGGLVFGFQDPEPMQGQATYSRTGLTLPNGPFMNGSGLGTIHPTGVGTGVIHNPAPGILRADIEGTVAHDQLEATIRIYQTGGSLLATSVITLTRQP
ncbi:MAG TPA: hypothetical protein VNZ57_06400 [Longimicrobiales bacterium]|nr:hypothetical protein [Longimicrobiales bacterium]